MSRMPASLHRALAEAARADMGPAAPSAEPLAGSGLAAQPVLSYATVPNAERYRRLMRVLWLEHRHFGLRLRPEEVAERARRLYASELTSEEVAQDLERLHEWTAVEREHDSTLASTPREYRRSRFTYDISPAGRRVEELLAELDELRSRGGALDGSRLPALRDALRTLGNLLAQERPSPTALRSAFEQIAGELEQLHSGALDFMRSLDRVVARGEQVDESEFERCKGALLEHLQGFRRDRHRHEEEIVAAIARVDRLGPDRLGDLIVSAQEIPELPGLPAAQVARARRAEIVEQWAGVRSWFVGTGAVGSPWQVLGDKIIAAIRAILDIAEAIVDRRTGRADRAHACLHLAQLASAGDAQTVLVAGLGVGLARHLGAPVHPDAAVADAHRTSWWDAPAAPVVAHLRRPGARTPGAGPSAPIADTSAARRRAGERRAAERRELTQVLQRFGGSGSIRLSEVGTLDDSDFRHLLAWIGRAFETARDATGDRHAWSSDGRARITLHAPTSERVRLVTPAGTLDTPNYALEVTQR